MTEPKRRRKRPKSKGKGEAASPPPPEGFVFIRRISPALKDQFKAYCSRRGTSMTKVIIEFMRDKVKEDGGYEPPREFEQVPMAEQRDE